MYLSNKVTNNTTIVDAHTRPICVENPGNPRLISTIQYNMFILGISQKYITYLIHIKLSTHTKKAIQDFRFAEKFQTKLYGPL